MIYLTNHAITRMEERKLPPELILDIMTTGKKRFRVKQKVYEYTKIIDGVKGLVLANAENTVITAYMVRKQREKKKVRDTRFARLKKMNKLQGEKME